MAIAALVGWLLTESLGAYMLRDVIAVGSLRGRGSQADRGWAPVVLWHAGLAATGLVCWVAFLLTGSGVPAWLAVGALAPAIGFGISAVTVWTPYPARPERAGEPAARSVPVSDEAIARALADPDLAGRLIDDLLAGALAGGPAGARRRHWRAEALIPAGHGVLAIVTFLLAMLAAIAAVR